jgi:hypothetical protein
MQRKILFRLIFIALISGTCVYYFWAFQKHLRSSSDPMEFLMTDVDGVIKVNDGYVFLNYLHQDSLPLHKELYADWSLWMNWKKENPIVSELMSGQSAYWVNVKDGSWYLFLPIPDRWNEDQLNSLLSGVPNLIQWEGCLVWSSHLTSNQSWTRMDDDKISSWRDLIAKCDGNASFSFIGVSAATKIALDYNRGEWIGFVEDSIWLSNNQAVQLKDSLMGSAKSTVWLSAIPADLANQDEMKKRVFSLDTLCQCSVLESWVGWQGEQWKYQSYDGTHWVASQYYVKNPLKAMFSFLKDTTSKVSTFKHPLWMPILAESTFPIVPRYISKRQGKVFVSDDSLSIHKAVSDTGGVMWRSDFSGFSENRFSIFEGNLNQFPGLSQFDLNQLIYPRTVGIVVVKNNDNWLLRIASIKE